MNFIYAITAYPFGKLADSINYTQLLAIGLIVLFTADLILASNDHWRTVLLGVALWGVHMGLTQGLLATMVANTAPAELRGTAYGVFNLVSGLAMFMASFVAGWLWETKGASFTFYAGAFFCLLALCGLALMPSKFSSNSAH